MIGVSPFTIGNWEAGEDRTGSPIPASTSTLSGSVTAQIRTNSPPDFPARLQVIRRELGLTQRQLARAARMSMSRRFGDGSRGGIGRVMGPVRPSKNS